MRMSEREFVNLKKGKSAKPKGPKEIDIQNTIRYFLRMKGWFVIRHQQGIGSHKGMSDLTAIKDGRTVYIEVKTPAGRLSADQERFQYDIESHGGTYIVARCIDDVQKELGL